MEVGASGDHIAAAALLEEGERAAVVAGQSELVRLFALLENPSRSAQASLDIAILCGIVDATDIDHIVFAAQGKLHRTKLDEPASRRLLAGTNDAYIHLRFHEPDVADWDLGINFINGDFDSTIRVTSDGRVALQHTTVTGDPSEEWVLLQVQDDPNSNVRVLALSVVSQRAVLYIDGLYAAHFELPSHTLGGQVSLGTGYDVSSTYELDYFELYAYSLNDMVNPESGLIEPLAEELSAVTYEFPDIAKSSIRYVGANLNPLGDEPPWSNGIVFLLHNNSFFVYSVDSDSKWWLHYIDEGEWFNVLSGENLDIDVTEPISNSIELHLAVLGDNCITSVGFINDSLTFDMSFCDGLASIRNWSDGTSDRFRFAPSSFAGDVAIVANIFEGDRESGTSYINFTIKGVGSYE